MPQESGILSAFLCGWETYQDRLIAAIAPLTPEQLTLSAGSALRPVGRLLEHIVASRASWMYLVIREQSPILASLDTWHEEDAPAQTAAALVEGFSATWRALREGLDRWTPEQLAEPLPWEGEHGVQTVTRPWIVWHLLEHDLHHGGEVSYTLGMHGLAGIDL